MSAVLSVFSNRDLPSTSGATEDNNNNPYVLEVSWTTLDYKSKEDFPFLVLGFFLSGFGSLREQCQLIVLITSIILRLFFSAQELQTVGPISDRMYVLSKYIDDKMSLINMLVYHSIAIDY